jgi:acetyl/propionyl-CoA carboxylase alpha subunit
VDSGANTVHPGYNFLSESPALMQVCADAGLVFVGLIVMNLDTVSCKTSVWEVAVAAGTPVVPGSNALTVAVGVVMFVDKICLPTTLRAAMYRKMKGVRVVQKRDELEALFNLAPSKALTAVIDGTVFAERGPLH